MATLAVVPAVLRYPDAVLGHASTQLMTQTISED